MDAPPPPSSAQEGLDTAKQAAVRHSGPATVMMAFAGISPRLCRAWEPVLGIQTLSSVSSRLLSGPIGWSLHLECITTAHLCPSEMLCLLCWQSPKVSGFRKRKRKWQWTPEGGRKTINSPALETEGEQSPSAFCS